MRTILTFFLYLLLPAFICKSQVIATNRNPVGMENNLLFKATSRFSVNQEGAGQVVLDMLFDGAYGPSYSSSGISTASPTIITIEGLSGVHTQAGAWVGWTTRLWPARRFKIEGFETFYNNGWITLVDYSGSDYSGYDFYTALSGVFTKLRFTFYEGTGDGGRFGLSEIFFIHPEATTPYQGLFNDFKSISEINNNVLIGKTTQSNPAYKLDVNGNIRANEIVVNTTGADFVFDPDYKLTDLAEIEQYIEENKHLPGIPSATMMKEEGMNMSEMQTTLLQKIEEITLYLIDLKKENSELRNELQHIKGAK